MRIAVLYAFFAALATGANLASQAMVVAIYTGPRAIELSILIGTLVGLPVKYLLEKRHIFKFVSQGLVHDGRLFVLYSFLGVFTTALFWGVEWLFHRYFGGDLMRYVGGGIGLVAGYVIKYRLDKRFVFVNSLAAAASAS